MQMEQTECSKIVAYKIQTLGNYPEESIQHTYSLPVPVSIGQTPVYGFWYCLKKKNCGLCDVFSKHQYTVSSAATW